MGRVAAVRFMGLYVPVVAAFLLAFLRPQRRKDFPRRAAGICLDSALVTCSPVAQPPLRLVAVQRTGRTVSWNASRSLPRMGSALGNPTNPDLP